MLKAERASIRNAFDHEVRRIFDRRQSRRILSRRRLVAGGRRRTLQKLVRPYLVVLAAEGGSSVQALYSHRLVHFLEINEIAEWCTEREIALEGWTRPAIDAQLSHAERTIYNRGERSGLEPAFATALVRAVGKWDECLLWVTLFGVWDSHEDWPSYYAMRGQHGEQRSLETAPGQSFDEAEQGVLVRFLTAVLENGWDAYVLPVVNGHAASTRISISHDGWAEVQSAEPVDFSAPAV